MFISSLYISFGIKLKFQYSFIKLGHKGILKIGLVLEDDNSCDRYLDFRKYTLFGIIDIYLA